MPLKLVQTLIFGNLLYLENYLLHKSFPDLNSWGINSSSINSFNGEKSIDNKTSTSFSFWTFFVFVVNSNSIKRWVFANNSASLISLVSDLRKIVGQISGDYLSQDYLEGKLSGFNSDIEKIEKTIEKLEKNLL